MEIFDILTLIQDKDTDLSRDQALDILYDNIDELLINGLYRQIDAILYVCRYYNFSTEILMGLLTLTLPIKSKLHFRNNVLNILQQRGTPKEYIVGLE